MWEANSRILNSPACNSASERATLSFFAGKHTGVATVATLIHQAFVDGLTQGKWAVLRFLLDFAVPVVTPIEHPFVQRVTSIAEAFAGKPASIRPIIGGTLPFLDALRRHVGVPGLGAPGNAAYPGSGAHTPNLS